MLACVLGASQGRCWTAAWALLVSSFVLVERDPAGAEAAMRVRRLGRGDQIRTVPSSPRVQPGLGVSGRAVGAGDVRLEVDHGSAVQEIHAREHDRLAGHLEDLDEAEPDGVDPPRSAGGEDAHPALLAAEQVRDLAQRCVSARVARAVQPAEQPGVVKPCEAVQAIPVRLGDLDGAVLGAVETGLDRRGLQLLVTAADNSDNGHTDSQFHVRHAVTESDDAGGQMADAAPVVLITGATSGLGRYLAPVPSSRPPTVNVPVNAPRRTGTRTRRPGFRGPRGHRRPARPAPN